MENTTDTDTQPDLDHQQRQCRAESAHLSAVRHATPISEDDDAEAARKTPVEER